MESCRLEMGMTKVESGSVWNTMSCRTHDRRMEVYLYFEMPEDAFVMRCMGEHQETRHIVMRTEEAVISPGWPIHSGCGSGANTFIRGHGGENQDFDDGDGTAMKLQFCGSAYIKMGDMCGVNVSDSPAFTAPAGKELLKRPIRHTLSEKW